MFCYIMKNVTIWSVQDLSGRKHACSPLSYLLMAFLNLSRIIMFNILPETGSNIIPL